jgi:hypothetical protein
VSVARATREGSSRRWRANRSPFPCPGLLHPCTDHAGSQTDVGIWMCHPPCVDPCGICGGVMQSVTAVCCADHRELRARRERKTRTTNDNENSRSALFRRTKVRSFDPLLTTIWTAPGPTTAAALSPTNRACPQRTTWLTPPRSAGSLRVNLLRRSHRPACLIQTPCDSEGRGRTVARAALVVRRTSSEDSSRRLGRLRDKSG